MNTYCDHALINAHLERLFTPAAGGTTVRRKRSNLKRGGWRAAKDKPHAAMLTPEGKRRRRQWLTAHSIYLSQLMWSEAER
jgi:hypothetical protein